MTETRAPRGASADVAERRLRQEASASGIAAFHHAFGGANAIHTDAEAAARANVGGVVQHGVRTLFPAIALLLSDCAGEPDARVRIAAKFLAAVKAGDTIDSTLRPDGIANGDGQTTQSLALSATNARGETVVSGAASITTRER